MPGSSISPVAANLLPGDPLLQQLTTKLHAGRPAAIAAVPTQKGKGQKKKDKSGASTPANGASGSQTPVNGSGTDTPAAVGRLWEVELDDTVIFPEGDFDPHRRVLAL